MTITMPRETLAALQGSIKKWQGIVAGTEADLGIDNCELCQRFYLRKSRCVGCPVRSKTKMTDCRGTPYFEFRCLFKITEYERTADTPERKAAAQAMLDFLTALLPDNQGRK